MMEQETVKNKIHLKICDLECTLNSEDKEDYVLALGVDVERTIQNLMSANSRVSLAMASMIAALSYCDELHKETANSDRLRAQIKEYLDEATLAKEEAKRLQEENDNLRAGMEELCADINDLKVQLGAMSSAILSQSGTPSASTLTPAIEPEEPVEIDLTPPEAPQEAAAPSQPTAPLRRAAAPQPVQTGAYTRPKSPFEPEPPTEDGFVSYFEQNVL